MHTVLDTVINIKRNDMKTEELISHLPAGDYYVGDLCYVLGDRGGNQDWWSAFVKWMFDGDPSGRQHEGPIVYDGIPLSFHGTRHGDGMFYDQEGRNYPVDAGMIGVVSCEELSPSFKNRLGNIVTFDEPFDTDYQDGVIRIGHLVIDTDGEMTWN